MFIELPTEQNSSVAVLVSGGTDSALLLYKMLEHQVMSLPSMKISVFTIPRSDEGIFYVRKIVDWLNENFGGKLPQPVVLGDGTVHHSIVIKSAIRILLEDETIDLIYSGANLVPEVNLGDHAPVRANFLRKGKICVPFSYTLKTDILMEYYRLGIEDLLKQTHSCSEKIHGKCGKCFNCRERSWAFETIGKVDPTC